MPHGLTCGNLSLAGLLLGRDKIFFFSAGVCKVKLYAATDSSRVSISQLPDFILNEIFPYLFSHFSLLIKIFH